MSDHYTVIISSDPKHKLSEDNANQVLAALKSYARQGAETTYEDFASIAFIDSGQNFSGVSCPYCGEGLLDWWSEAMTHAYSSGFESLYVTVPCCKVTTMISQLHYFWPCGFAGYAFRIRNNERPLQTEQMTELSKLAGTALLVIYQHV